jgi:hypothetical protein
MLRFFFWRGKAEKYFFLLRDWKIYGAESLLPHILYPGFPGQFT